MSKWWCRNRTQIFGPWAILVPCSICFNGVLASYRLVKLWLEPWNLSSQYCGSRSLVIGPCVYWSVGHCICVLPFGRCSSLICGGVSSWVLTCGLYQIKLELARWIRKWKDITSYPHYFCWGNPFCHKARWPATLQQFRLFDSRISIRDSNSPRMLMQTPSQFSNGRE